MPLLRRPRVPRRRARTSLSPLLENTNQTAPRPLLPYVPPSTLLTSYTACQIPQTHYPSFSDSGIVVDASYQRVPYYRPLMEAPTQVPHPATYTSQFQTPVKEADGPTVRAKYAKLCGSSPVTDHLNKTGQIQSVPPRFVCSDRKSDGKVSGYLYVSQYASDYFYETFLLHVFYIYIYLYTLFTLRMIAF